MAREFDEVGEPETLQEEEPEENEFTEIELFERPKEDNLSDEQKFDVLKEDLKKLAYSYKAMRQSKNDAYQKKIIELWGDHGMERRILREFENPGMHDLNMYRYWMQFQEGVKSIRLQDDDIKDELEQYLQRYIEIIKELIKMYLNKEKQLVQAQQGEIDERAAIKKYFGTIGKAKEMQLIKTYEDCDDLNDFRTMTHPYKSSLTPAERMFLRVLNRLKGKFTAEAQDS